MAVCPISVTIGTTGYYAQGTAIALSYSGDVPLGYQYGFTASAGTISGSTLTMPAADVTVSPAFRSTGETVEVSYVDAGGNTQTDLAIALDGHEAVDDDGNVNLAAGTYYVGTDITYANRIYLYGDVTLILADGKTMTLNDDTPGIYGGYNLTIYGQSLDAATAGTLRYNGTADGITVNNYEQHSGNVSITTIGSTIDSWVRGIYASVTLRGGTLTVTADGTNAIAIMGGTHSILGGQLTANATGISATGIYASTNGGTITLGCTTASDFIYVSSYRVGPGGRLNIADGQTLFDEYGNYYSGNGVTIPGGKTLRLYGIALTAREAPDGNYWTTYYNSTLGLVTWGQARCDPIHPMWTPRCVSSWLVNLRDSTSEDNVLKRPFTTKV